MISVSASRELLGWRIPSFRGKLESRLLWAFPHEMWELGIPWGHGGSGRNTTKWKASGLLPYPLLLSASKTGPSLNQHETEFTLMVKSWAATNWQEAEEITIGRREGKNLSIFFFKRFSIFKGVIGQWLLQWAFTLWSIFQKRVWSCRVEEQ